MKETKSEKSLKTSQKGRKFEQDVAALYRLMGYTVQQNIEICQKKVDILASIQIPGTQIKHRIIVECKNEQANTAQNQRVIQFNGLLDLARKVGLADSAEIITRKSWSDQAKGFAASAGIGLCTFEEKLGSLIDFSSYIYRIIYDYEHFEEYVTPEGRLLKTPIIEIMNRSDLYRTYIPLVSHVLGPDKGAKTMPLDSYVEKWLVDPYHNHLSILGDFGTGKSSFCLHLTYELAKRYREDPINARIPLFISLRDYTKAIDLQQLITDLLLNRYNIRIENFAVFQRFLESGRLVLVLDGFDEMATKTDRGLTIRNFDELTKAVVAGSKTILTCRTHYFTDQRHVDGTLRQGEGSELMQAVCRRPNFQIVELEEFSDEQIQQLLRCHRPGDWPDAWIAIRRNLHDLARRPLLLDMIIKTLPQLLALDKVVNTVHLYDAYTRLWIEREDWHARMTPEGKQAFMEDLAMRMWISGALSIHYQDLRQPIRDHFREEIITRDDLDSFDHDTRSCSFLNRDAKGNYRFIHKSFMECFAAKRIFNSLKENIIEPSFREREFTPEVCSFVAQLVSEDLTALDNLCHWAFDKTSTLAWNAISILPFLKAYRPEVAVDHLARLCKKERLKSGIIWVLGELGIEREDVLLLMWKAVRDPSRPDTWWEAAFALAKLEALEDPVQELIGNLPSEWTYERGVGHLGDVIEAREESSASVDQRAVVAVVKEHRAGGRTDHEIEETIEQILRPLNICTDLKGRRSYFAVWLLGELRMSSLLSVLFPVVKHPQSAVRNMLAEALGKIGEIRDSNEYSCIGDKGLNVLSQLLSDNYYRTRVHAAEAIGKVRAITLLPDLKRALEGEPLQDVQNALVKAIHFLEDYCMRAPSDEGK